MNASRFFANTAPITQAATLGAAIEPLDLSDVVEAQASAQYLDYEIQQLESMASGIANLEEITANSLQDAGLTSDAYAVVKSQASHIMKVTGHEPVNVNVQHFDGGQADRSTATSVTMLALADTAKNIWNAIIKAIKEAMAKVRAWFAKMTNAVPSLIKKFEELRKKANDKTEGLKDEANIKLPASSVAAIGTGKTPKIDVAGIKDLASTLAGNDANVKKVTSAIIEANKGAAEAIGSAEGSTVEEIKSTVTKTSSFVLNYIDEMMKMGSEVGSGGLESADKLGLGEKSRILALGVGNQGIVFNVKTTKPDALAGSVNVEDEGFGTHVKAITAIAPAQLSIRNIVDKPEDAEEFEFKAFSTSEIATLCDDNIELLTGFKKWKEDQVKIDKERETAVKKTEEFAKKAEKIKGPEGKEALVRHVTDSAKAAAGVVRQTGSLLPSYVGLVVKSSNILLSVGSQSLSAHK